MSGIYIPGMKMPTACYDCPLCYDLICCLLIRISDSDTFNPWSGRLPNCPLIPVPDHGDLIDADVRIDVAQGQVVPRQTTIRRFLLNHVDGLLPIVVIPADDANTTQSNTSNALDALDKEADTT